MSDEFRSAKAVLEQQAPTALLTDTVEIGRSSLMSVMSYHRIKASFADGQDVGVLIALQKWAEGRDKGACYFDYTNVKQSLSVQELKGFEFQRAKQGWF